MSKKTTKFFLTLTGIFGLTQVFATEMYPFYLERQDGTVLEGYFSPPSTSGAPIIFAVQGSSCESVLGWHKSLSDQASALGLGVIALEKQGISREGIDLFAYSKTNCLQNRLEDYVACLANAHLICPGWEGKPIFWGESEGGMLAASLAGQIPETAAVLLFGAGGGMKPREEVKWALQHRLEKQGAMQDEIDGYVGFLDEQMDAMILDPTPEKQFLGNTYKWWASFLAAEEAAAPLNQQSLPICLIHGAEDSQIPVISADLAAEGLAKTNALTYLRLEGYGHELNTTDVQDVVCRWLTSVLFGQELSDGSLIAQADPSVSTSLEDSQADMSDYVFSRGKKNKEKEGKGEIHGSFDVKGSEEEVKGGASVKGAYDFGNGFSAGVDVGGSGRKDGDGNARGEVHGKIEGSYGF
jgi:pimeloyl-ACP methyl ester carboxylesterase